VGIARPEIASTNSLRGKGKRRETHPIKSSLCSAFSPYYSPAVLAPSPQSASPRARTGSARAANRMLRLHWRSRCFVQSAGLGVPLIAGDSLDPHSMNWTKRRSLGRSRAGRPVGGGGMFRKPHPPSEEMTARREGLYGASSSRETKILNLNPSTGLDWAIVGRTQD
jgi:hypothetical protein